MEIDVCWEVELLEEVLIWCLLDFDELGVVADGEVFIQGWDQIVE